MKKRLFVIALSALMLFTLFAFTACGGSNPNMQDLEERIAQLEQELADAKAAGGIKGDTGPAGPQGPKGDNGDSVLSDELVIYKLSETAKVYNNGMLVMTIKYESKTTTPSLSSTFIITNHGFLPDAWIKDILSIQTLSLSLALSGSPTYASQRMLFDQEVTFTFSYSQGYDWMCFSLKDTGLIFAAFEI